MAETGIGSHGQISDVHSDAIREPRRPAKLLPSPGAAALVSAWQPDAEADPLAGRHQPRHQGG